MHFCWISSQSGRDNPKTFYPPVTWTESINKGTKMSRVNQQRYTDVKSQSTKVQRCPESINKDTRCQESINKDTKMLRINQQRYITRIVGVASDVGIPIFRIICLAIILITHTLNNSTKFSVKQPLNIYLSNMDQVWL